MSRRFHMPVYEGTFLEPKTDAAFREAFASLEYSEPGKSAEFFELRFHVVGKDGDRCIADKNINLHPDPVIFQQCLTTRGSDAFSKIVVAWARDDLAEQSLVAHPFPASGTLLANRMADRFMSLYWRPEFCVLAQEYVPTFLEHDRSDPIGEGFSASDRTALGSLILPKANSAHEKLKKQSELSGAMDKLEWLWKRMITLDLNDIELVLDDPGHPQALA